MSAQPASIKTAVIILWASFAAGIVKSIVHTLQLSGSLIAPGSMAHNFAFIGTALLSAFLIYMISRGRDWARLLFTLLFIVPLVPYALVVHNSFTLFPVTTIISLACVVAEAYAIFLMFKKPGSDYFKKPDAAV